MRIFRFMLLLIGSGLPMIVYGQSSFPSGTTGTIQITASSASPQFMVIDRQGWGNVGSFAATSTGDIDLRAFSPSFGTPQLFLKNGGFIGLGTTSPTAKLHVKGYGQEQNYVVVEGSTSDNLNYPNIVFKGGTLASTYPSIGLTNGGVALHLSSGYSGTYNYRSEIFLQGGDGSINFQTGLNSGSSRMIINNTGNVLIGKTTQANPAYKLDVSGTVRADEIKVNISGADFVFEENYPLPSLKETEKFIRENKHLPDILPATEMERDGVELGNMNSKFLQKIEELTLHLIELNKKLERQQLEISDLKSRL